MVAYQKKPYRKKYVAGVPRPNKVIRKKPKTKHAAIRTNATSVYKLAKQVNSLKMSQHGSMQRNLQNLEATQLIPTATAPLLFDCTDFTCIRAGATGQGCQVYQVTPTNTVLPASGFQISDWSSNPYWSRQNQDIVDTGKYLPVWVKYTIRVEGQRALDNTRIRVDLFTARSKALIPSGNVGPNTNIVLPTALIHLKNMADPTLNRLNPTFFKKYKSKTMLINSAKTDPNTGVGGNTSSNIRYYTFTICPKKMKYQGASNPDNPQDPTAEVPDGNFGPLNVPVDSPFWCLISTDDGSSLDGDRVAIKINRECKWRDSQGSAYLY